MTEIETEIELDTLHEPEVSYRFLDPGEIDRGHSRSRCRGCRPTSRRTWCRPRLWRDRHIRKSIRATLFSDTLYEGPYALPR